MAIASFNGHGDFKFITAKNAMALNSTTHGDIPQRIADGDLHATLVVMGTSDWNTNRTTLVTTTIPGLRDETVANNTLGTLLTTLVSATSAKTRFYTVTSVIAEVVGSTGTQTTSLSGGVIAMKMDNVTFSSLAIDDVSDNDGTSATDGVVAMIISYAASPGTYNAANIPYFWVDEGGFGFLGAGSDVTYQVSDGHFLKLSDA